MIAWIAASLLVGTRLLAQEQAAPASFTTRTGFVATPSRAPASACDWAAPPADEAGHIACLLDIVGASAGQVVADIGCGSGRLEPGLARRVGATGRIVGRDIDADALTRLQTSLAQEQITNVEAGVSTPGDVKIAPASLDLALLCDVYQQVRWQTQEATRSGFLASLRSALKPGAVAVVLYDRCPENLRDEAARATLLDRTLHDFVLAGFLPGRRWRIGGIGATGRPVLAVELARPAADAELPWWDLWNGRDLTGWSSWLGPAHAGEPPLGRDSDERQVFSVTTVDGEPALRVSGEVWGLLEPTDDFDDFELVLEFKWGEAVWPPLNSRDAGIFYRCFGPQGAVAVGGGPLADPPGSGWFPRCFELQLTEGDTGSLYGLGDVVADTESATTDGLAVWKRGGVKRAVGGSHGPGAVVKSVDAARPVGAWNELTIRCSGDTAVHVVNGVEVVRVSGTRRVADSGKTGEVPLLRGRIALQSESAELFFRHLRIRPVARRGI